MITPETKRITPELAEALHLQFSVLSETAVLGYIMDLHEIAYANLVIRCKRRLIESGRAPSRRSLVVADILQQFDEARWDLSSLTGFSCSNGGEWRMCWEMLSNGIRSPDPPDYFRRWRQEWLDPLRFLQENPHDEETQTGC